MRLLTLTAPARPTAAVVISAWLALGSPGATAADSPAELAQNLQRRYDSIKDFSADFIHSYEGGVLRKHLTERGRLLVKKPGMMRWQYTIPEPKLFVSDGTKFYSYIPQDKQVVVTTIRSDDSGSIPALFLAGKGNLTRDFLVSGGELPPGSPSNAQALKLVPKTPQPDYDWLVIVVDTASLSIRGLVTVDAQGGQSAFSFLNLKENVGLLDRDFAFKMPRGVDVITDSPR
jgi:outer membrane lipoprotein carrier protein